MAAGGRGATARWWAPGRVNLIGEHTDYNDGFALPFALELGCTATVARRDGAHRVRSLQQSTAVEVGADASPTDVPPWVRYALGPVWVLRQRGIDVPPLDVAVDSAVPIGAGLASSAALVCSVTTAIDDLLVLALGPDELLAVTRAVENDVVGAPTGGMDQLVSLRAAPGHVVLCDLRNLTTEAVPFPLDEHALTVLVVDTGVAHRHADGEYAARRRGCERAAAELGVAALRDVEPAALDDALARLSDDESRRYLRHVVTENARVLETAALLRAGRIADIGPLLSASHASMRDDYRITVPAVDLAVAALDDAGALGSRMTGGGFGGCVIALIGLDRVEDAVAAVRAAYAGQGLGAPRHLTVRAAGGARSEGEA